MTASLRCALDRVLILPDESPIQTEGGLWLADESQFEDEYTGRVMDVGPDNFGTDGRRIGPSEFSPGQHVLFNKLAGSHTQTKELDVAGFSPGDDKETKYRAMQHLDVWGVFEPISDKEYAKLSPQEKTLVFTQESPHLPLRHYKSEI